MRRPAPDSEPGSRKPDRPKTDPREPDRLESLRARIFRRASAALRSSVPEFGRRDGPGILVGFSGGLDSTALLRLVVEFARRFGEPGVPAVVAAHLDHALRPDAAEQARFAERAASRLEVPFVTARRDIARRARRERRSPEEAGRLERLDFFGEVAAARGLTFVALGHTLTDQAETLLLRLARGAGGLGLGAMPPERDDERGLRIVRPLLGVSRAELAALAAAAGWSFYEDPSNAAPEFTRNRIRREVLPLLGEAVNPRIEAALGRAAELLREDEKCLAGLAARRFGETATVRKEGDRVEARIPEAALRGTEPALERRLVRHGLLRVRGDLRRLGLVHIEAVLALARSRRGGASLDLPGATARLEGGWLTLRPAAEGRRNAADPAGSTPTATPAVPPTGRPGIRDATVVPAEPSPDAGVLPEGDS